MVTCALLSKGTKRSFDSFCDLILCSDLESNVYPIKSVLLCEIRFGFESISGEWFWSTNYLDAALYFIFGQKKVLKRSVMPHFRTKGQITQFTRSFRWNKVQTLGEVSDQFHRKILFNRRIILQSNGAGSLSIGVVSLTKSISSKMSIRVSTVGIRIVCVHVEVAVQTWKTMIINRLAFILIRFQNSWNLTWKGILTIVVSTSVVIRVQTVVSVAVSVVSVVKRWVTRIIRILVLSKSLGICFGLSLSSGVGGSQEDKQSNLNKNFVKTNFFSSVFPWNRFNVKYLPRTSWWCCSKWSTGRSELWKPQKSISPFIPGEWSSSSSNLPQMSWQQCRHTHIFALNQETMEPQCGIYRKFLLQFFWKISWNHEYQFTLYIVFTK